MGSLLLFVNGAKTTHIASVALFVSVLILGSFFIFVSKAQAAATVNPANGGTNISIDRTSAPLGTGQFKSLTGPSFGTENGDISVGTHTIHLPAGWEFDQSSAITIIPANDIELQSTSITPSSTSFSFVVLTKSTMAGAIIFGGMKVRPTGTAPGTGAMAYSGAGIAGVDAATNFGTLTSVPGTVAKLAITTQPGNAVYGSPLSSQPVVKTQDQFGNDSTNGLGASKMVTVAVSAGTGSILGTASLDIGTTAGNGTITYSDITVDTVGAGKQLSATADGLSSASSADFEITPKPLTVSGLSVAPKTYDGSDVASIEGTAALEGIVGVDDVSLDGALNGSFDSANAGSRTIAIGGLSLIGEKAGNYSLTPLTLSSAINPKEVVITPNAGQTKVYGESDPVLAYANSELIGEDQIAGDLGRVDGENVGNYAYELGTLSAGDNYSLELAEGEFSIAPRILTVSAIGIHKVYDGTVTATVTLASDELPGDNLTLEYTEASFPDKTAAADKTVSVIGISKSGAKAGNYTLASDTAETTAAITQKSLTATLNINDKTYNGNANAVYSSTEPNVVLDGVAEGDDVTPSDGTSKSFSDKHVGNNKTVTAIGITLSGTDSGNYSFNGVGTGTANINVRPITVTASADTKVYDGTDDSDGVPSVTSGTPQGTDAVAFVQTYDTRHTGIEKALSPSGSVNDGNNGNNYSVTFVSVNTGEITAKPVTVTAQPDSKIYDGTTASDESPLMSELAVGDSIAAEPIQSFDTKDVGTEKTLSASGLIIEDGNDGNNYDIHYESDTAGEIITKELTIDRAETIAKEYDGNDSASVDFSAASFSGVVAGDEESISMDASAYGAAYDNKNAGENKQVSVTGVILVGAGAVNYSLTQPELNDGIVNAKPLTAIAEGLNKTYDGTVTADVNLSSDDIIEGDIVTIRSASAAFEDKDVGIGKAVMVSGIALSGTDADNYSPTETTAATAADIAAASLTITANDTNKVYGSDEPAFTVSYSGFVGGDTEAVLDTPVSLGRAPGEDVGSYVITPSDSSDTNYEITFVSGTLTITATDLSVTSDSQTKERGTNDPELSYAVSGLVNGDTEAIVTGTLTRDEGETTGTYGINQGTLEAGANYVISFIPGTLTIVDTIAPTVPTISITSDNSDSALAKVGDTISLAFSPSEDIQTPVVTIAGHDVSATSNEEGGWTASYTMQSDDTEGSVAFSIVPTDIAGNQGNGEVSTTDNSEVAFDKTPPEVNISAPGEGARVNGSQTISFTDDGSNPECSINGNDWDSCQTGVTLIGALTGFADLSSGGFTLSVRDMDAAGNVGSNSIPLTKDTEAPTVGNHAPSLNALNVDPSEDITVTFSESVVAQSGTVTVRAGSADPIAVTRSTSGNTLTIDPDSTLASNTVYTVTVSGITDEAENALPSDLTWSFTTATSYSIALEANSGGWNLISLPIKPANTGISSVLGSASSSIQAVWTYDPSNVNADESGWLVYYPSNTQLSNLSAMTAGYGYWISVTQDATLSGSGSLLSAQQVPPSRTLSAGWNLIGYYQIPGENSSTMANAFSSIGLAGVDYTSLWSFDNSSGAFRDVSDINPGDAFWISVPQSGKMYTPSNLTS